MADKKKSGDSESPKTAAETEQAAETRAEQLKPKQGRKSGGKLLVLLVGVVVIAFIIAIAGFDYFSKHSPATDGTAATDDSPTVGGPFTLVNQDGNEVTEKDFADGYMLIYFGFTYCPDVCPTALSDMSSALEMLSEDKSKKVTPVFISVDPARDTPVQLAEYVKFFHPRLVGLTGTEEQVKNVTRAYRVYYSKNAPTGDDPQDYLVDHTSIIYLVGPDGKLVTHFSHGTTPEAMAERLGQLL